nr:P-loop NTPase fold protein [Marinibacterium profundimaris]
MIVADNETAVDLLYYEAVAKTVVRVVSEKSDEPLSVGVHGDWGAGKSSILMMVEQTFKDDERVLCIRFNGWLFQGFDDAKTVLIETIVEELMKSRSGSQKVIDQGKKTVSPHQLDEDGAQSRRIRHDGCDRDTPPGYAVRSLRGCDIRRQNRGRSHFGGQLEERSRQRRRVSQRRRGREHTATDA